ncbi:hypothetical protein [Parendozoicomonas haliclonae]|uniref:Uncharacterized protein n=1 Tax=Parendozoicomonas haliclonae TaxID=1960125 RepID=A0A1X7ARB5_9GAMM|nr:hypothetical protein [Parendozoicomonas haliclonae]SMA50861.1 hypothetical protein EHSB41UT_04679 [Parendozoicomonas haliclonae]
MTFTLTRFSRYLPMAIAILMLSLIFTNTAMASESGKPELPTVSEQLEEFKIRLQLTPEQISQIEPLLTESRQQRTNILKKYGLGSGVRKNLSFSDKRDLAKDLRRVRDENTQDMAKILNKEQFAEFETIQEEQREAFRKAMKNRI